MMSYSEEQAALEHENAELREKLAAAENELRCTIFNLDGAYDMRDAALARAAAGDALLRDLSGIEDDAPCASCGMFHANGFIAECVIAAHLAPPATGEVKP